MSRRKAVAKLWVRCAAACICITSCTTDPRLSLGHHQASALGDSGPAPIEPPNQEPPFDAAFIPMAMVDPPDASQPVPPPPSDSGAFMPSPCQASIYMADLICAVSGGGPFGGPFGGGMAPPPPMQTATALMLEPVLGTSDRARVTGQLAFSAWGAEFQARLVGMLDCAAETFHADIVDGTYQPAPGSGFPTSSFTGQLDGALDPITAELFGVWWHAPQSTGDPRCNGMWTASRLP